MSKANQMPKDVWENALRALERFFSRHRDADDLVQETLAILWSSSYDFCDEAEFKRIAYGCAKHVLSRKYRREKREAGCLFDEATFASWPGTRALTGVDKSLLLKEVLKVGETQLSEKDWKLILEMASMDNGERSDLVDELNVGNLNNLGVRLLRARDKLARLTGWHRTKRKRRVTKDNGAA